jgi:uncharacterized membrane protein HdeD (DUF308 family)
MLWKENVMDLQLEHNRLNPNYEECLRLHHCWPWFLILGIAIMVLGAAAIGSAFIATLMTVMVFGILLLVGGVVQVINAFLARTWRGFFTLALVGALQLIIGGLMIEHPLEAGEALTLMMAIAFVFGGVTRLIYGVMQSFSGRGWVLLNGLVTLVLGLAIWRGWPQSSVWVIGLFVGIDLLFSGWSWVMLGLAVKYAAPPKDTREHQEAEMMSGAR